MSRDVTQPSTPPAGGHTIAVVSERTGLSRDVLRVWERRYGAVHPDRTSGGQRLYSDEQLSRFLLLAEATRHGRTISSVAGLSSPDLERLLVSDAAAREGPVIAERAAAAAPVPVIAPATGTDGAVPFIDAIVERALVHTAALNGAGLGAELRRASARSGLPLLVEQVIPRLMHRIGDEWMAQRLGIPHEHLASAVVIGILLEAVRSFPERQEAPRLLVATPAGEQHVIGAALIAAAAALDGWRILFLGADLPSADIAAAAADVRAVAISMVRAVDVERSIADVRALRALLDDAIPVIVGGASAVQLRSMLAMPGIFVCQNIAEARSMLDAMQ